MAHRVFLAGCLLCLFGLGRLSAADPPAADPDALARRAWTITEVVLDKHVESCTRQEMLLGGVRRLLGTAGQQAPGDLGRRVSAVTTPEQFAALLREVWRPAEKKPAKPDELDAAFVSGLLAPAPGRPILLPPDVARLSEQVAGNRYVGIGVQIRKNPEDDYPQIVDPARRGAARRAGAKPGDLIVEVDGKDTHAIPLRTAVEWLRGDEGTPVTIVVRQPKETETRTYHLTRAKVPFDTVFGYRRLSEESWRYRVDPQQPVGYARVVSLNSATLHDLRQLERSLRADGVRALVLDLRSCTATDGQLGSAELVADGLLDGGVLWRLRDGSGVKEVRADAECLFRGWPLAVLVGSELFGLGPEAVAAALQDNGRAVLVGEPVAARVGRFFDGEPYAVADPGRYVTSLFPLPDNQGSLQLPIARVERTARDRDWPVRPDHVVKLERKQKEAVLEWSRQQELSEPPAGIADNPAPEDPQLAKAVALLRDALRKAPETPKRTGGDR